MKILKVRRLKQRGKFWRESYSVRRAAAAVEQKIIFAELEEVTTGSDLLRSTKRHENYFPARHSKHLHLNDSKKIFDTQKNL